VLECFKMSEDEWKALDKKRKLYRDWAKVFRYGCLLYGGEPETAKQKTFCPCPKCSDKVPDTLDLGRNELRALTDAWFARHHKFSLWRNRLLDAFGPHGTRSIKMPPSTGPSSTRPPGSSCAPSAGFTRWPAL